MKTEQTDRPEQPSRCWAVVVAASFVLWGVGCAHSPRKVVDPTYTPSKAPTEALIDSCENVVETQEVRCPLQVFLKGVYNFADLWEYSQKCGKKLTACQKFGAVDRAELQGEINREAARADKNARHFWWAVGAGLVLTVVGFVVGAVAF